MRVRLMSEKILCVDDDENVLSALQRHLRKEFHLDTALGPETALRAIHAQGPYAVVVSDFRMPGMNGIELLARVKEMAPDTIRIMLTGNAGLATAIAAVNEGNIFRFLTKPCEPTVLAQALRAAIRQYQLVAAERDVLEKTLNGSIRVLTEILSLVDPPAFGHSRMLRECARTLAQALKMENVWEVEMAAMLSQIGRVTVPPATMLKERTGRPLAEFEKEMLRRIPETGYKLLANIPRLESVGRAVLYQHRSFDGADSPQDSIVGTDIPLGARVLKVIVDLMALEAEGLARVKALEIMKTRRGRYDSRILNAACSCWAAPQTIPRVLGRAARSLSVKDLRVGQILQSDVVTSNGTLLISAGNSISETVLERIKNFARISGVKEPLQVAIMREEE